jgi:hypothetical protein
MTPDLPPALLSLCPPITLQTPSLLSLSPSRAGVIFFTLCLFGFMSLSIIDLLVTERAQVGREGGAPRRGWWGSERVLSREGWSSFQHWNGPRAPTPHHPPSPHPAPSSIPPPNALTQTHVQVMRELRRGYYPVGLYLAAKISLDALLLRILPCILYSAGECSRSSLP